MCNVHSITHKGVLMFPCTSRMFEENYIFCTILQYEALKWSLPLSLSWHETPSHRKILMKVEKLSLDHHSLLCKMDDLVFTKTNPQHCTTHRVTPWEVYNCTKLAAQFWPTSYHQRTLHKQRTYVSFAQQLSWTNIWRETPIWQSY